MSFYKKPDSNTGRHLVEDHDLEKSCGRWQAEVRYVASIADLFSKPVSILPSSLSCKSRPVQVYTSQVPQPPGGYRMRFYLLYIFEPWRIFPCRDSTEKSLECVQSRTHGRGHIPRSVSTARFMVPKDSQSSQFPMHWP